MHLAVGTSLATIIPTSVRSVRAHAKRGAVDFAVLRRWAPAMFAGTLAGTLVAGRLSGPALTGIFAVLVLIIALNLAFGREEWRVGSELPRGPAQDVIAATIGALSAFMGIGGGTFGVPAMTLYGFPILRAVATSAGLGLIISIPGAAGFIWNGWGKPGLPPWSFGYVNLVAFACLTPAMVLMAPFGAKLAHTISRKTLPRVFATFLAFTSAKMFYDLFASY